MRHPYALVLVFPFVVAVVLPAARADAGSALESAAAALGVAGPGGAGVAGETTAVRGTAAFSAEPSDAEVREAPPSPEKFGELTLAWQSRSLTDWWWVDVGPHGRHTSSVRAAVEFEHAVSDAWTLWFQADSWFDTHDARWSSSWTDSVALIAAGRLDLGDDRELELGARYDDWMEMHASRGDPWAFYAQVSFTVEAFGGELSPYLYHEIRRRLDGPSHDGTWTTDLGAEFEAPIADAWTLGVTAFVGRLDGSATDPDVWALGGRVGVAFDLTDSASIGVFTEFTRVSGAVPDRTLGAVGVEVKWEF